MCSLSHALIVLDIFEGSDHFYLSVWLNSYKCFCICNDDGGLGLTTRCMDMGWVLSIVLPYGLLLDCPTVLIK
jgi:hypothetical protein